MAQLASASGLGPEGPVFESQYPDLREVVRLDDLFFRIWPGLYAVPTGRAKLSYETQFAQKSMTFSGQIAE